MNFETEILEIQARIDRLLSECPALDVTDQESYDAASEYLCRLKTMQNSIGNVFSVEKQARHEAHKRIITQEKELLAPLSERFSEIDSERRRWKQEQEREAERLRKIAEDEERLRLAVEAEARGHNGDHLLDESVPVPVPLVGPIVRQAKGISDKTLYSANVTDLIALVNYVAANPQWIGLLDPNTTALNQLARAQKELMDIPGVMLVKTSSTSVRTR